MVQGCLWYIGYHEWEGLSLNKDERKRIAKNLGNNKVLIMKNHGLLTVGETAGEAFMNMYYAIRMCEVAVQAEGSLKLERCKSKCGNYLKNNMIYFHLV